MNFIYSAKIKKLFFVDVIEILTDSVNPTVYWRKLKQRLREEWNETVTNCHALKMFAKDGKNIKWKTTILLVI